MSVLFSTRTWLENVEIQLNRDEVKVLTLDFFDTLVFRKVPRPTDAFLVLAKRLRDKGVLADGLSLEQFKSLRVLAEQRAREKAVLPEVTLNSIWRELPQNIMVGKLQPSEMVELEIEVEASLLRISSDIVGFIDKAHETGRKVAIVSDTYFSSPHLIRILELLSPGLTSKIDHIFTSCDHGSGKYADLFTHVLRFYGIHQHELIHVGDNYVSDIKRPGELGIRACFLPHGDNQLMPMIAEEERIAGDITSAEFGDAGLTSLRSRATHSAKMDEQDNYFRYGAQVLGPVFTYFVDWVFRQIKSLDQSKAAHITHILPLMREGYLLDKMLKETFEARGGSCLIHPVWISRRVLFQATITEVSFNTLNELVIGRRPPTLAQFLKLIGLIPSLLSKFSHRLDESLECQEFRESVISYIVESKDLSIRIISNSKKMRQGVLQHLALAMGMSLPELCDGKHEVAIVDVGWNGTIQKKLVELLRIEKINMQVTGFYLMTTPAINSLLLEGVNIQSFLVVAGKPEQDYNLLSRTLEILEQSCTPPSGSSAGYSPSGMAIVESDSIPERQRSEIAEIQKGVMRFQSLWLHAHLSEVPEISDEVLGYLRAILIRAFVLPTPSETEMFGHWVHDENLVSRDSELLISVQVADVVSWMTPRQFISIPMSQMYWPLGTATKASHRMAAQASAVLLNGVNADLFEHDTGAIAQLYYGAGDEHGFSEDRVINAPVLLNTSGLCNLSFKVPDGNQRFLRFDPVNLPSVVRIDFLKLSVTDNVGPVVSVDISGAELGKYAYQIVGAKYLGGSLYATGTDSQIVLDIGFLGLPVSGMLSLDVGISMISAVGTPAGICELPCMPISTIDKPLTSGYPGIGCVDSVNGVATSKSKKNQYIKCDEAEDIKIIGWCADKHKLRVSSKAFVCLTSEKTGKTFLVPTQRVDRADVSEALGSPVFLKSGFFANILSKDIPPDLYGVSLMESYSDIDVVTPSLLKIEVV